MSKSLHSEAWKRLLSGLIAAREDAGVTQIELGQRLNRTQSFISKVERGERRLDVVEFCEWARLLGYQPDELIVRVKL